MRTEREPRLSPRMQRGIDELKALIQVRYPDATFQVTRSPEDRRIVHLKPVVDVDDRDEVMDVVIDRMMELQIEEQLPLFVVPVRPAARNEALRAAMKQTAPAWQTRRPPLEP